MFKVALLIAASVSALRIQEDVCCTMTCGTTHTEKCPPCDSSASDSATATEAHDTDATEHSDSDSQAEASGSAE